MDGTGTVRSTSTGIEIWRWVLKEPARARIRLLYCARIRVAAHGGFFRSERWRKKDIGTRILQYWCGTAAGAAQGSARFQDQLGY